VAAEAAPSSFLRPASCQRPAISKSPTCGPCASPRISITHYPHRHESGLVWPGGVRDAGSEYSALAMKPFLVGRNPLDFDTLMSYVLPYAGSGRAGGGYSAIDLALNDFIGRPTASRMAAPGRQEARDRAHVLRHDGHGRPQGVRPADAGAPEEGFTFFKMDVTTNFISGNGKTGAIDPSSGAPTDKGLAYGGELIAAVRDAIGYDKPLAVDASSLRCGSVPDGISRG